MPDKQPCKSTIIRLLDDLDIEYMENVTVSDYSTKTISTSIFIQPMQLGIDLFDTVDVSLDANPSLKRNHLQKRALCAKGAKCGLVQMTVPEFQNSNTWAYIASHIKAQAEGREAIGARKCSVEHVDAKTSRKFLRKWHSMGDTGRANARLGLVSDGELVALVTAGKQRFSDDDAIELMRYCTNPRVAVSGGFGKLIAALRKSIGGNVPITSFADLNAMMRPVNVYETDGWKLLGTTPPDYRWENPVTNEVKSRYSCMKHRLVAEGADPALSESQIMQSRGFMRVFGAGSLKYILR